MKGPTKTKRATSYTGLPGLDKILNGVRLGDNVVFQVDTIDDYVQFVRPFCQEASAKKRSLIYFRFADHEVVIPEGTCDHIYELHPELGFENFISEIFHVIEKFGKEAFYVFDCLSELSVDWYSDRMLGNFFMLACPYLYDYDTVAYFGLIRNRHTSFAIDAIPQHRPGGHGRLSRQGRRLRSSAEGGRPAVEDDVHAAPLGRARSSSRC